TWVDPARAQVRELSRRARLVAAEAALAAGQPGTAARHAEAAMAADALDEAAHRWFMSACGRRRRAGQGPGRVRGPAGGTGRPAPRRPRPAGPRAARGHPAR